MKINFKKLTESARTPTKAYEDDACYDLYADEQKTIFPCTSRSVSTGLAFEIPTGYCIIIYGRSGLASKNTVFPIAGVIDSKYRGEVKVCLYNGKQEHYGLGEAFLVNKGDKIAQFKLEQVINLSFEEVNELSNTDRGTNGFGSSDSKV